MDSQPVRGSSSSKAPKIGNQFRPGARRMQVFQRVGLVAAVCVAISFLVGCQGLVAGGGGGGTGGGASHVIVSLSGSGSGKVTSSPTGIDCGTTCTADFN